MPTTMTVTPAYGRDYKSKAATLADWNAGLDFVVASIHEGGRYINRADAVQAGLDVWIRYSRLTKIVKAD